MRKTFTEQQQKSLIKKFHFLLTKADFNGDDKQDILADYKVKHTTDLSCSQLIEICERLSKVVSPELAELDACRKRVIKAIAVYLERQGYDTSLDYIKAIACRSAGTESFNAIPLNNLRAIYSTFCTYNKTSKKTAEVIIEEDAKQASAGDKLERVLTKVKPLGDA